MPRTQYARPLLGDPLRRLVEDSSLEHETSEHESAEHEQPASGGLRVGAVDDREELDADRVADRVLARLAGHEAESEGAEHECAEHEADRGVRRTPRAGQVLGAAGGDLDSSSSAAIEGARGGGSALPAGIRREMEAGFGHSLADVRIHTDERAAGLSRQMSARAFTTGRDIFFDKGEFSPGTTEGKRVLAHEIAHTRQDGGVRRKLRGTSEAMVSQGEVNGDQGKTSGKLRKLVGKLTNWDKLVGAVRAYEAEEGRLLAGGKNPDPLTLASAKPGMLKLLAKIQQYAADWRKANPVTEPKKSTKGKKGDDEGSVNLDEDPRSKATRRQAVSMLEPRVALEVRMLSAKDGAEWLSSLGLTSKQMTKKGESDEGQKNKVDQLDYETESGSFSGFYKQDKGFAKDREGHEAAVGIEQIDPNYGARNIALYRLDRLFGAGLIARAEFAVSTDENGKTTMGTVMEKAKGTQGGKLAMRHSTDKGQGGVGLDDPKLQSGLNKLQILDAIAGQLDRHMNNLFIDTDNEGNVTSITGIDNDMAFGGSMRDTSGRGLGAQAYKGLPEYIDQEMGEKILQVKDSDIRDALAGLLTQSEIDATVARFQEVFQAVQEAKKAGKLQEKWDVETAKRGFSKVNQTQWLSAMTSYQDNAKARMIAPSRMGPILAEEGHDAVRDHPRWSDLPDQLTQTLHKAFSYDYEGSTLMATVRQQTLDGILPERDIRRIANAIISAVLDRMDADRYAVDVQEMSGTPEELHALHVRMSNEVKGIYAQLGSDGLLAICAKVLGKG
jgi:hypothetical protein